MIPSTLIANEAVPTDSELNGAIITTRVINKTKRKVILYLTNDDLQEFTERIALCTKAGNCQIIEATTKQSQEPPMIEVEEITGAINLHKVTLTVTTNINDEYKFA